MFNFSVSGMALSRQLMVFLATVLVFVVAVPSDTAIASTPSYNAANNQLSFIAPPPAQTAEVLNEGIVEGFHRFENVISIGGVEIDAIVEIIELVNSESASGAADNKLDRIDDDDSDPAIELDFSNSAATPGLGYVVFDIQFVNNNSEAVILENVAMTVTDVDNNQFVQFGGLSSYTLATTRASSDVVAYSPPGPGAGTASFTHSDTTPLTASVPVGSAHFFASGSSSSSDSLSEREKHWVQARFATVSELRIKTGSYESGGMSIDFEFLLSSFSQATTDSSVTRPSFTVSYDANSGAGGVPTSSTSSTAITVAGNTGSPALERAGYTFEGWNTRADGSGATFSPGSTILPVSDTVLYALWTPISQGGGASEGESNPAIHLDLQRNTDQTAAGAPVLMEGEGLRPGSAYSLVLREPARAIRSGTANTGGRFGHVESLPADLKPGSYTITLSAIGKNGESLVLTQSFRIGTNGTFTQIGTPVPTVKGGLAQTGPDEALVFGGLATAALATLVGVGLALANRRRATSP